MSLQHQCRRPSSPADHQMDSSSTEQNCQLLSRKNCTNSYQEPSNMSSIQDNMVRNSSISVLGQASVQAAINTMTKCTRHRTSGTLKSTHGNISLWCIVILLVSALLNTPAHCLTVNNSTAQNDEPTQSNKQTITPSQPPPHIEQLEPYTPPSNLNILECFERLDNSDQVVYVCGKHPDMIPILMYAESLGKQTCESAFKDHLWNCSGFSILREPNVTKGAVSKESTYVYTLSIAVIAHSVAKACSQKLLKSCSCDDDLVDLPTPGTEKIEYKQGCSDNVDYGLHVAEMFLKKRYTGINLKHELIHHNIRAAKLLIRDIVVNAPVTCTCHGVSGSCTFQTCHSELPDFSYIADKIKKKYSEACKVTPNSHSENTWVSECGHDFTEHDLIYREENDWCVINPSIGSVGVSGRECEVHSDGSNSCENLCTQCGSRPIEQTENIERENKCSFHFCCEIRCTVVKGQKTYHTCS